MAHAPHQPRDVWITGIGLLSSLGEGVKDHWQLLQTPDQRVVDEERFAPHPVHPLKEPDWSQQISRRDMRQMEPWQQIGTYAAGLALDDAGVKGDEELLGRMDMIVAAGGGERDIEVDSAIIADARTAPDRDALLAERLSNDLRPTLFLAQLSNLLAGNISIVHKVTGSSRTFMGEEGAGISAIQTAHARIASGQSDIVLVGGAYNAERSDMLLLFELGGYLHHGNFKPIGERTEGGFVSGSAGAFLIIESREHAEARSASGYARLSAVAAAHGPRSPGAASNRLQEKLADMPLGNKSAVLSAMTGCVDATNEERAFLADALSDTPVRSFGNIFGHALEAQFPLGVALAALAVHEKGFYPPFEKNESAIDEAPDSILVTTVGHYRAEGLATLTRTADT